VGDYSVPQQPKFDQWQSAASLPWESRLVFDLEEGKTIKQIGTRGTEKITHKSKALAT